MDTRTERATAREEHLTRAEHAARKDDNHHPTTTAVMPVPDWPALSETDANTEPHIVRGED